jgi:hypothetical protein
MIRKITLLFLLCIGFQSVVKAQNFDSVTIAITPYTDTSCPGTQLRFIATQSNDTFSTTTYQWYTDGFPTDVTIDTFYTTALNTGDFVYCEIYYTDSTGALDSAMSNIITIYHSDSIPPRAIIALTVGSNPDCGGHPLTFTATPVNGGSAPIYQWMVNDTAVTGADSATFSGIFAGGDSISCMIVSNSPCAPFDTAYSNVIPVLHYNLTAAATISVTRNPICAGTLDTFNVSLSNEGSGYNVAWYVDTSTIPSALGNAYMTDSLRNGDLVYCILTAPDSCILNHTVLSNVITMTVIDNLPSSVSVAITKGTNPGCLDSPVVFTATYANFGTAPATTWYVNGFATDYNTNMLDTMLLNGDVVSFKINETDGGCYINDSLIAPGIIMIRDSTPVTPLVSLIGDKLIANTSGNYTWYGPDSGSTSPIPGAINQTYQPLALGYYYAIRDSANCPSLPSNVIYISLLGVNTISNAANVKVFPNPTSGILNLEFDHAVSMQLDVYSMSGQVLMHEEVVNQAKHATDLSHLAEGNYLVVIKGQDGSSSTFKVLLGK